MADINAPPVTLAMESAFEYERNGMASENDAKQLAEAYVNSLMARQGDYLKNYSTNVFGPSYPNERFEDYIARLAMMAGGAGGYYDQMAVFCRGIDRFKKNYLPLNVEKTGFTFISRPILNFTDVQLKQDRCFSPLMTRDPRSIPFMIRSVLDPFWTADNLELVKRSPLCNPYMGINNVLSNALVGMSGWPDVPLATETSKPGFFGEDITQPIGIERMNKTYDLNLTFRDINGGVVMAMLDYMIKNIGNLCEGIQIPYVEAINDNKLYFTQSIYRFTVDPTWRHIVKWSKAVGCFPTGWPIGAYFNFSENNPNVSDAGTFTIPWTANGISYNDPIILTEFNMLIDMFAGTMYSEEEDRPYSVNVMNNFCGVPYVMSSENKFELVFRRLKEEDEFLYVPPKAGA